MFPTEVTARSRTLGNKVIVGDVAVDEQFKLVTIEDEYTEYTINVKGSTTWTPAPGTDSTIPEGDFDVELSPRGGNLTNVGETSAITISFPAAPQNFIGTIQVLFLVYNSLDDSEQTLQINIEVGTLACTSLHGSCCTLQVSKPFEPQYLQTTAGLKSEGDEMKRMKSPVNLFNWHSSRRLSALDMSRSQMAPVHVAHAVCLVSCPSTH